MKYGITAVISFLSALYHTERLHETGPTHAFLVGVTSGYMDGFLPPGKGNERGFDGVCNLRYEDKVWGRETDGECAWIQVGGCFCLCVFFFTIDLQVNSLVSLVLYRATSVAPTCLLKLTGRPM